MPPAAAVSLAKDRRTAASAGDSESAAEGCRAGRVTLVTGGVARESGSVFEGAVIGRDGELDFVEAFLDEVGAGPAALVLSGESGIGKTILWQVGVEAARSRFERVLTCRATEAEAALSFAGLSELLGETLVQVADSGRGERRDEDLSVLQFGELLNVEDHPRDPLWTPVFGRIAGVVTDAGGVMCHAAIVAREYGLPAVLGTGSATRRIATGNRIRVDANNGIVIDPH